MALKYRLLRFIASFYFTFLHIYHFFYIIRYWRASVWDIVSTSAGRATLSDDCEKRMMKLCLGREFQPSPTSKQHLILGQCCQELLESSVIMARIGGSSNGSAPGFGSEVPGYQSTPEERELFREQFESFF